MKTLIILSWILTGLLCLWMGSLILSVSISEPLTPDSRIVCEGQKPFENQQVVVPPKWGDFSDRAMAAFTFVLAVVAAAQWWTGNRLAKITQLQLENQWADLRAYVSFSLNLNEDHDPVLAKNYILDFNCSNVGRTPAIDLGFVGSIWVVKEYEQIDSLNINYKLDEKRVNLFPNERQHERGLGFSADTQRKFTQAEIDMVHDGRAAFIVALKIWYKDIFGRPHETEEFWSIAYASQKARRVSMIPGKSRVT